MTAGDDRGRDAGERHQALVRGGGRRAVAQHGRGFVLPIMVGGIDEGGNGGIGRAFGYAGEGGRRLRELARLDGILHVVVEGALLHAEIRRGAFGPLGVARFADGGRRFVGVFRGTVVVERAVRLGCRGRALHVGVVKSDRAGERLVGGDVAGPLFGVGAAGGTVGIDKILARRMIDAVEDSKHDDATHSHSPGLREGHSGSLWPTILKQHLIYGFLRQSA